MLNTGRLEAEITRLRSDVTQRQEAYASLQEQHTRDLDEMRSAGHQAMAIIVEEYKVLVTVLCDESRRFSQCIVSLDTVVLCM